MEFEALKKVAAAVLGMDPDERGVEEETGLLIPTEGLEKITTVREAVEWIKKTRSPL